MSHIFEFLVLSIPIQVTKFDFLTKTCGYFSGVFANPTFNEKKKIAPETNTLVIEPPTSNIDLSTLCSLLFFQLLLLESSHLKSKADQYIYYSFVRAYL